MPFGKLVGPYPSTGITTAVGGRDVAVGCGVAVKALVAVAEGCTAVGLGVVVGARVSTGFAVGVGWALQAARMIMANRG
jgi:hypothetical protein